MSNATSSAEPPKRISVLPQHVVDQIAAGEVVQRPASVIKEVLENSLDAGSTHIVIKVEQGGLSKMTIMDNGCGISREDLALAATRHATSKLTNVQDFSHLQTFGFRGEALASISTVSRLTLTSRTATSQVAYTQTYKEGQAQATKPKPSARKPGTTLMVQDLFYNVPHRLKTYKKRESDEYARILQVVQHYAIHYPHCGFCLERKLAANKSTTLVDVNTSTLLPVKALSEYLQKEHQLPEKEQDETTASDNKCRTDRHQQLHVAATKAVMAHVLEPKLENHLAHLYCSQPNQTAPEESTPDMTIDSDNQASTTLKNAKDFVYQAEVYFTKPSYKDTSAKKSHFILFLNDRLVDLPVLKRTLEEVYVDFSNVQQSKPILVVSVTVPGNQVDVNVHPSKRQVALMYQEELCQALASQLRTALQAQGQTFSVVSTPSPNASQKAKGTPNTVHNPYLSTKKRKTSNDASSSQKIDTPGDGDHSNEKDDDPEDTKISSIPKKKAKRTPASQLIRTSKAAPVGAIEPFLVAVQPSQNVSTSKRSSRERDATPDSTPANRGDKEKEKDNDEDNDTDNDSENELEIRQDTDEEFPHKEDCPLSKRNLDLSKPGAFAQQCTCAPSVEGGGAILIKRVVIRPKKVVLTKCTYSSIHSLRKRVNKHTDAEMAKHLREAHFVGVVSHFRSLIQCGEQLILIHHMELAEELFYQLALARFGGVTTAQLGDGGVDGISIKSLIAEALQLEDDLVLLTDPRDQTQVRQKLDALEEKTGLLSASETNQTLAEQAAACLEDHADMLEEYFGIRIESEAGGEALLTGLPILMDGHMPQPHGLGIFLLRLATQVVWDEERPCFQNVCQELAKYYARLPTDQDEVKTYVQHTLFPSISYLLLPSTKQKKLGNFMVMTKLSTLYKIFERC